MLDLGGIILFALGAGYVAFTLHRERIALSSDRRAVWKRAEELLKLREEETTKRKELNQGFDWSKNLPMIMQFLGGRGIDTKSLQNIDVDEVQSLIQQINTQEEK